MSSSLRSQGWPPGEDLDLESTARLLLRARSGDAHAQTTLYERFRPILMRLAHGRIPDRARDLQDTEDIVQNTLGKAFQRLDGFRAEGIGAFLAYLRKILINELHDSARRAGRRPWKVELPPDLVTNELPPLEATIGREVLEAYESALDGLSSKEQQGVILRVEYGFSYDQIAQMVHSPSANAARMMIKRSLARIAEKMAQHRGTDNGPQ